MTMAIADELTKLEANRANIVRAINSKGGELADNAGLAACPEAIEQLGNAGGATLWTGHVDEAGLRYIGWNDADIANLKANICWNEEDDELYAVPQDHKDLWDACEKVVVNGRTMIAYSEIGRWINYNFVLRYHPMVDFRGVKNISIYYSICHWMIGIPQLDTSAVTSMQNMFSGCVSLLTIPLLNTSSVTNMQGMFNTCASLRTIPQLDTSAVTSMQSMFSGCVSLLTIPLLNTSSVTNMQEMFSGCTSLVTIPQLDTSSVTNMDRMFIICYSLVYVPFIDASKTTIVSSMFSNCYKLKKIDGMQIPSNADRRNMFSGCSCLRTIPIAFVYDSNKCDGLYRGSAITEIINDDMSKATILSQLITSCRYLKKLKLNFTKLCTNLSSMFDDTKSITELSFEGETSFEGITSANAMMSRHNAVSIPKSCVTYTMCTQLFNTMLRGVPAYSAASYPMYFESGSAVDDDAAGTLQSLVEQCQAMGWAIYNLTINPYTE